jgi:hypothetical protein
MNPMLNNNAVTNISTRVRSERSVALVPRKPGEVKKSDIVFLYGLGTVIGFDNFIILQPTELPKD